MKLTGDSDFDVELRKLVVSIRKLDGTAERPIARRNARQRVLYALRRVRTVLDEKTPAIVERGEIRRRTHEERIKQLKRDGWVEVLHVQAGQYAAVGVSIKRVAWTEKRTSQQPDVYVKGIGWKKQPPIVNVDKHERLFVPRWAVAIGPDNPSKLRAAKKDSMLRRSVVAEKILQESA